MISFFIFGIIPTAIFGGWVVAYFIWEPYVQECLGIVMEELPYEIKYPFLDERIIHDNLEWIADAVVIEETPQGYCALQYNPETEVFEIWADADVQYRYLETLARHFVQKFRCEKFFINRFEELTKKIRAKEAKRKADAEGAAVAKDAAGGEGAKGSEGEKGAAVAKEAAGGEGAKGSEGEKGAKGSEGEKGAESVFAVLEKSKKQRIDHTLIISEKANRYIKKGRFSEMNFFNIEKAASPIFTFGDFLKVMKSS